MKQFILNLRKEIFYGCDVVRSFSFKAIKLRDKCAHFISTIVLNACRPIKIFPAM